MVVPHLLIITTVTVVWLPGVRIYAKWFAWIISLNPQNLTRKYFLSPSSLSQTKSLNNWTHVTNIYTILHCFNEEFVFIGNS